MTLLTQEHTSVKFHNGGSSKKKRKITSVLGSYLVHQVIDAGHHGVKFNDNGVIHTRKITIINVKNGSFIIFCRPFLKTYLCCDKNKLFNSTINTRLCSNQSTALLIDAITAPSFNIKK